MKEKPILFSTPMVQAIQAGTKNQTRRTAGLEKVNESPDNWSRVFGKTISGYFKFYRVVGSRYDFKTCKPRFQNGDRIWVKETFRPATHYGFDYPLIEYRAGGTNAHCEIVDPEQLISDAKWKPSLFMPKAVARIWLECTGVRCERLQDITEKDCINEGIEKMARGFKGYNKNINTLHVGKAAGYRSYISLWESINGRDSWLENPWVFIYDFKVISK